MPRPFLALALFAFVAVGSGRFVAAVDSPPAWAYRTGVEPVSGGCKGCHLPNGFGRPDSAALAGLPPTYIAQQIADYRKGARRSAEPVFGSAAGMVAVASTLSWAEVALWSQRFASISYTPWIRVVESTVAPRSRPLGGVLVRPGGDVAEPIGNRIIEMAEDKGQTGKHDDGAGFVAYVPVGSIDRGEALVTTGGGGRTVRCALCHGDDLKGLGPVPGLAGRSPSYQVRQLYDMQRGARHGLGSDLMRATVARLATADMIAIAAYTASRHP